MTIHARAHLGCHVEGCPYTTRHIALNITTGGGRAVHEIVSTTGCKTQVADTGTACYVGEHILGLKISVDYAVPVDMIQPFDYLSEELPTPVDRAG